MNRQKILIVGASGQLGTALIEELRRFATVVGTYYRTEKGPPEPGKNNEKERFRQLDIQNGEQVQAVVAEVQPDIIINTAAMTHVDNCERFPDLAESINVQGHFYLAEAAKKRGAKLVFISTYYVFDGRGGTGPHGSYTEEDQPQPLNTYAKTKVAGELITRQAANSLVIRTSKIYSWGYDQRNFLARLINQFKRREKILITNDQYTNPISTVDAAMAITQLIAKEAVGIYHLGGWDYCNNYEFALLVAQNYGFEVQLLQPQSTEQFQVPAPRPKQCALHIQKLIKQTSFEPRSLEANLTLWKNQI